MPSKTPAAIRRGEPAADDDLDWCIDDTAELHPNDFFESQPQQKRHRTECNDAHGCLSVTQPNEAGAVEATSTSGGADTSPPTLDVIAQRIAACHAASYPEYCSELRNALASSNAQCIIGALQQFNNRPYYLQKISECVGDGSEDWTTIARRVLVVGAALLDGDESVLGSAQQGIDALVDWFATLPHNSKLFFDACCCKFHFSQLHHPGKLTLGEMVEQEVNEVIQRPMLGTVNGIAAITRRHLKTTAKQALQEPPSTPSAVHAVLNNQINAVNDGRPALVIAVGGTSGSGKTIAAIEAATRFAAGVRNPPVSTLYMLASDVAGVDKIEREVAHIDGLEGAAEVQKAKEMRNSNVDNAVMTTVKGFLSVRPVARRDMQKSVAVVVIDEVGEYPMFVRGVCASSFTALRKYLNVDGVVVMVVGTGVDVATNAVGSSPDTFVRANVDSKYVSLGLLRAAANITQQIPVEENVKDSPLDALLKAFRQWAPKRDWVEALEQAPRLRTTLNNMSHNPRMMAALAVHLSNYSTGYDRDPANDLAAMLERAVDYALERFVMLSGLASLDFRALILYFSCAFAMSLDSDASRGVDDIDSELVVVKYGLVADHAKWYKRTDAAVLKGEVDGIRFEERFLLGVPKDRMRRYEMSPALIALSFRLFGRRYPEWSGEGFERTLAEYLSWVGLAAHSGRPITIFKDDPLAPLKRALVEMGLGADGRPMRGKMTLWRVVFEKAAISVQEAEMMVTERVAGRADGRHLVVALNKPTAPFADILVGLVQIAGGNARLQSMVLVQAKHLPGDNGKHLSEELSPGECVAELQKMMGVEKGCPTVGECAVVPQRFIVLRVPNDCDIVGEKGHPEELLCVNDSMAEEAFSPSSLGRFIQMKPKEMAPLEIEREV